MASKKDNDDMKRHIQNWMASKKYAQVQKELEERRNKLTEIMEYDKEKLIEYMNSYGVAKNKLSELVNQIIEQEATPANSEFNWFNESYMSATSKTKLLSRFTYNLMTWYTYVLIYQRLEDYEFCAKLKQVIDIDKKELLETIDIKYGGLDADDLEIIQGLEQEIITKTLL